MTRPFSTVKTPWEIKERSVAARSAARGCKASCLGVWLKAWGMTALPAFFDHKGRLRARHDYSSSTIGRGSPLGQVTDLTRRPLASDIFRSLFDGLDNIPAFCGVLGGLDSMDLPQVVQLFPAVLPVQTAASALVLTNGVCCLEGARTRFA